MSVPDEVVFDSDPTLKLDLPLKPELPFSRTVPIFKFHYNN